MLREPSRSTEESFAEGWARQELLIIKKINSASVFGRGSQKERYIERAKGPSEWT